MKRLNGGKSHRQFFLINEFLNISSSPYSENSLCFFHLPFFFSTLTSELCACLAIHWLCACVVLLSQSFFSSVFSLSLTSKQPCKSVYFRTAIAFHRYIIYGKN